MNKRITEPSERQAELMVLIVRGATVRQIARVMGISEDTVKSHSKRLYAKLGVCNRSQLAGLKVADGTIKMTGWSTDRIADVKTKEKHVLRRMAAGKTDSEIATEMGLTRNQVKGIVNSLGRKLETTNRVQVITRGFRAGLWDKKDLPTVWVVPVDDIA